MYPHFVGDIVATISRSSSCTWARYVTRYNVRTLYFTEVIVVVVAIDDVHGVHAELGVKLEHEALMLPVPDYALNPYRRIPFCLTAFPTFLEKDI